MSPSLGNDWVASLASCQVQDLGGHHVNLGETWRERPVLLALIRHFG